MVRPDTQSSTGTCNEIFRVRLLYHKQPFALRQQKKTIYLKCHIKYIVFLLHHPLADGFFVLNIKDCLDIMEHLLWNMIGMIN